MLRINLRWSGAQRTTPQSRYVQMAASVCHMLFRTGPVGHCSRTLGHTVSARILLCPVASEWVGSLGIEPTACVFATATLESHGWPLSLSAISDTFCPAFVGVHIFKDDRES